MWYPMSSSLFYTYDLSVWASAFYWTYWPDFFWLPVAESSLFCSLAMAALHNLVYSGLTHLVITQDLVLTGKNIKKKREKVYKRKAKERQSDVTYEYYT